MADHIMTLTPAEELLVDLLLARHNAARAADRDAQGQPLPPLTTPQFLLWAIRNDLANVRTEVQASTQELFQIARNLTAAQRTALLAQIPDGPRKQWLAGRIAQGS